MKISVEDYGRIASGEMASLYTLENNHGLSVSISNFGGIIVNLMVPDKNGEFADIVLAHADVKGYQKNPGSFGAVIGRNANRIRGAVIELDEIEYPLVANHFTNNLHTGPKGLQFRLFDAEATTDEENAVLRLYTVVQDLEDGFPGNLEVEVSYTLTNDDALVIEYAAVSDKDTIINLTNHSYFNLAGHDSGTISGQLLWMDSSFYSPNDEESVPTGETLSVIGTPMDFTAPTPLGTAIASDHEQIKLLGGIDNNFMLNGLDYRRVATLSDPESGRIMHVSTDLPAMHLYTGNNLPNKGASEKDDASYVTHAGVCFETQTVPNSAALPWLASPLYAADDEYYATTTFRFEVEKGSKKKKKPINNVES